jgi:methylated-DNA-[protein]-cysteine S-methyltransferase
MQTHIQRTTFDTPIGRCAIAWREAALTGFSLPDAAVRADDVASPPDWIAAVIGRVRRHLTGKLGDFTDLPYDFANVPTFNAAVLRATLAVPAGQTRSYGEIARAIGEPPGASRAVGVALGANHWPLLIPCHRIVSATGKMTGFSGPGGIKTKLRLLAIEGAQLFAE